MAQSIRERTNELAVLKTLGFGEGRILALVLMESLAVAVIGGGLGLLVAWVLIAQGDPTNGMLPAFYFPDSQPDRRRRAGPAPGDRTGLLPALQARRLKIVDALRRT